MISLLLTLLLPLAGAANDDAPSDLAEQCFAGLKAMPGKTKEEELRKACRSATSLPECVSEKGTRIFHVEVPAKASEKAPKRILVLALIHGDERPSGSVARSWMERLTKVEPRNRWRVVPILNPDGVAAHTRYNARGVDVNRNFPTTDWEKDAISYWETKTKKDKRRFPGTTANSEKETKCAIAHLEDYKPDLVLSIHTPYGVLDFDGPKVAPPNFKHLPWKSLGSYPGSLGRYLWVDHSKPILTIELGDKDAGEKLEPFDRLQDISGDIAIKSEKLLREGAKPVKKEAVHP